MLLGFDAFAAQPFAASGNENNVTLAVTGNQLTVSIGDPGITADSVTEIPDPNPLTLGTGTVSFAIDVDFTVTGSAITLATGTVIATGGADVSVSGNNVVISSGTVTITADANVEPSGIDLTAATGTAQAITWSEIVPGVSMTWVEIDPGV
jgi:hypothetical protein